MKQPLMLQSDCADCKRYEGFGQCYEHGNNLIENCIDYRKNKVMKANEAPKSKFVYPDKLYARTNNNITLDISYAPQTLEAVEYTRTDAFIYKIQTELDKLYHKWFDDSTGLEVSEEGAELGALDMAYEAFQEIIDNLKE